MRTIIGIVALVVALGGVYALNRLTRTQDGHSRLHVAGPVEVPVEIAHPEEREIVRAVQCPGEVEAFAEVDISSEVMGKILEMPVEEGDSVQAGDLLCRLDDADFRARVLSREANVARLRAAVTQAKADLEKAQLDYDQEKRLIELGGTSVDTVTRYRTILIGAQAVLEMRNQELIEAQAMLQLAREDLAKTVITSPIAGVVAQRFAKPGEVVITGTMNNPGTRIMVVSDLSKMQVRCRVDESDAPLVAPDQPARIYLQSDTRRSIAGRVLRVGTKGTRPLGRDVVTFEILVLITGADPRVKPGMTANVEIEVARRDRALTVPVQAIVYRKRRDLPEELVRQYDAQQEEAAARQNVAEHIKIVFCVADGKARPQLVQTGISDAAGVEISGGLSPADSVVTGPFRSLDQIKDGSAVKIIEKPVTTPTSGRPASQPTTAGVQEK